MGTNVILELGPARTEKGVSTQHLWVAGFKGRRVPALVLMPEDANGQRPVVLLGHGVADSKDDPKMLAIARWLVRREHWAVVLIDGPVHGERRSGAGGDVSQEGRVALGKPETYEEMTDDWRRTLDACGELPDVGNQRAAYLGFSMGTLLGVPMVAAESRFRCAVFAIGGAIGERQPDLITRAAKQIERPVLQINQSEDLLFSREAAFRLYDALSGPKRIFFHPGGHSAVPREAMARVREFLHDHLADEGGDSGAPRGSW